MIVPAIAEFQPLSNQSHPTPRSSGGGLQTTTSRMNSNVFDLTGQLTILDFMAKFTGNYSSVYLGGWNGNFVAVKVIKSTGGDHSVKRKLLREVTLWASTIHPNIQPFYGFANDQPFGPFGALVSPWCLNGDASQYLRQNGGRMVTADRWAGVIEGVVYLHRHDPVIVHGDLKPGNILIDDRGVPRICDFGLARVLHDGESMGMTTTSEHTGTERYLAPELVISDVNVYPTTESDVYALGCLGLEFIYDQKPYAHRANNLRGGIIIDIRRQLPPATSPPHRSWVVNHFWPLIQQLWNTDPRYRPSAFNAVFRISIATRNLPSTVLQRIINLSSFLGQGFIRKKESDERASSLCSLCLVSRSFCAWTTPLLYRDIYLTYNEPLSFLSRLKYTLGYTATNKLPHGVTPNGYGSYTKRLCLCLPSMVVIHEQLSSEIQDVMLMMRGLRYVEISAVPNMGVADFGLSTLDLNYVEASCIIGHRSFLHAMPYLERLSIEDCTIELDVNQSATQRQYGVLILPSLREMHVFDESGSNLSEYCRAVTHWVIPNLRTLKIHLSGGLLLTYAAFISLLRVHGSFLWDLELGSHNWQPSPLREVLSLCNNLHVFTFQSEFDISLSHFPVHATLEMLELTTYRGEEPADERCMSIVQEFTSLWGSRLPSLRMIKLEWNSYLHGTLIATFRSEDNFYTFNGYNGTDKRYSIATGSADMSDT